jgi:hypothetical protein
MHIKISIQDKFSGEYGKQAFNSDKFISIKASFNPKDKFTGSFQNVFLGRIQVKSWTF